MSHTPLAQLNRAHKKYGNVVALDGLDLRVEPGELLALLGPNGAGKSTAISLLLGLQRADSGEAQLFGQDPQNIASRRRMGVMMQEVALPTVMKVREHIAQVASYYPNPHEVEAVVERLGLQEIADRPYGKLSGGQRRQVQFAMAIAGRPELLFLDEPTVGLDVKARGALWRVVRDLIAEGTAIVLTTHYLEEAEALADSVAVIARGRVIARGSVDEIRAHVSRKQISCFTSLSLNEIRSWPEVMQVEVERERLQITTRDAEAVLVRLLTDDTGVHDIEVKRAGLAEAFTELTNDNPNNDKEKLS